MSSDGEPTKKQGVERLPQQRTRNVTDGLNDILSMVRSACPPEANITFDFDGELHVHIDVRSLEEVLKVEGMLPGLGAGIFRAISRGDTPHHPFFHRLSAIVDR